MHLSEQQRAIPPNFKYESFSLPENVNLIFNLTPHWNETDLPDGATFTQSIRQADAVILEGEDNGGGLAKTLQKISQGDVDEYQRFKNLQAGRVAFDRWILSFMSGVYATRTPILNIDVDVRHLSSTMTDNAMIATYGLLASGTRNVSTAQIQDIYNYEHEGMKIRDQQILHNLKPALTQLMTRNRRLGQISQQRPLDVAVYYGTARRSLYDAVAHKNQVEPVNGFTAQLAPECETDNLEESLYANYLRGIENPRQLILRSLARTALLSALVIVEPRGKELPIRTLDNFIDQYLQDKDLEDIPRICQQIQDDKEIPEQLGIATKHSS